MHESSPPNNHCTVASPSMVAKHQGNPCTDQIMEPLQARSPRLDFPIFDLVDPVSWTLNAEQFFVQ